MALAPLMKDETPEQYHERIKGLYERPKNESVVRGVSVSFADTRITVRMKRDPKQITTDEIELLANEYGRTYEEMHAIFSAKKRKIKVIQGNKAQMKLGDI